MGPVVEMTYYYCRLADEKFGPVVRAGDRLVYRGASRFAWIDPIFDLEPGTVCQVLSIEYDEAAVAPDYDPYDSHYHYRVRGLEEHGTLVSAEIVALFGLQSCPDAL